MRRNVNTPSQAAVKAMHPYSDIWAIWSLAAVFIVGIGCVRQRWYSREAKRREQQERIDRGYQRLLDDLVVGNEVPLDVEMYVLPTPKGSIVGWHVDTEDLSEAAQTLINSPIFKRRATA